MCPNSWGVDVRKQYTCRRILANELAVEPAQETVALVEQIRTGTLPTIRQIAKAASPSSELPVAGQAHQGDTDRPGASTYQYQTKTSLSAPETIKILFLAAIPQDITPLQIDEEMRVIDQALRMAEYQEQFELRSHWAVRYSDLQELLLRHQPHIVHFSGHGSPASELIFESEHGLHPVSPAALSTLFAILKDNLRCVVLNACYSEVQARAIAQHIDCVIGMADTIGDTASINFVSAFYRALGYGRSIQEAFNLGSNAIDLANLADKDIPQLLAFHTDPAQVVLVTRESSDQSSAVRTELELPVSAQPLARASHNLPTPPTALIGRKEEIATALALLRREDVWLVTLSGPGGSGKTRLALEIAFALVPNFADGVFFVDLAPLQNPALVLPTIAHMLGLQEAPGQTIEERLHHYLQEKRLLLLLDNFEQVGVAAPHLTELHRYAPNLTLLVTSRARLRLRGEKELPVPPLPLPERGEALANVAQSEAVQLFVDRVQDVQPGFILTESNAATVAAICTHLDGLPLAIELAAARCNLLRPQALLEGLAKPLRLLTRGARDLPDRQQTLRATIAWSYNLLAPDEQTLFRRLAVFAGGFTLEAVTAVCAMNEGAVVPAPFATLDGLATLVDNNLVQQEEVKGELRFRLLETIREYAAEQLPSATASTLRDAHATYYAGLLHQQRPHLFTATYKQVLAIVGGELDNIRQAWQWLIDAIAEGRAGLPVTTLLHQMAEVLANYHLFQLLWLSGQALFSHAVQVMEGAGWGVSHSAGAIQHDQLGILVHIRLYTGLFLFEMGQYRLSLALAEELLDLCRALKLERDLALALLLYGRTQMRRGVTDAAVAALEEALAESKRLGMTVSYAEALFNLGMAASNQGSYAQARTYFEQVLALCQEMGYRPWLSRTLNNLGTTYERQHDYERGRPYYEQALIIAQEEGDQNQIMIITSNLGDVERGFGRHRLSATYYKQSLTLARSLGDRRWIAANLNGIAITYLEMHDLGAAERALREALTVAHRNESTPDTLGSISRLGHVLSRRGQVEMALRALAFVEQHPSAMARDRLYNEPLLAELHTELSATLFDEAAAWAAGQSLDDVVRWLEHSEVIALS